MTMFAAEEGRVDHDGASIWYASRGVGPAVILLHGGLGSSDDWNNQITPLCAGGHKVVVVDSRGHGRSTWDGRPFSYELLASDVVAVMNHLDLACATIVGWSDGAIIGLVLAMTMPSRIDRVLAFGGNMDLSGVLPISPTDPVIGRMFERAAQNYARLSPTPEGFPLLSSAVIRMMQTQPNYSAEALHSIDTPVTIVAADADEFIKPEHSAYLARTIPGAELVALSGATHFAPLNEPDRFNQVIQTFLSC